MPGFYIDIFQQNMGEYTPDLFPSKNVWLMLCNIFQCIEIIFNIFFKHHILLFCFLMYSTVTWKLSKKYNFKDNIPPSKGPPSTLSKLHIWPTQHFLNDIPVLYSIMLSTTCIIIFYFIYSSILGNIENTRGTMKQIN